MWIKKYKFGLPQGRYSLFQANTGLEAPLVQAALVSGGADLLGGLIGGDSGGSVSKKSTFSPTQQSINRLLTDLLLGITRDSKGNELSRNPLLTRLLSQGKGIPPAFVRPFSDAQNQVTNIATGLLPKIANPIRPDLGFVDKRRKDILGAALGGNFDKAVVVGEDGLPEIAMPDGMGGITVIPNPGSLANPERAAANSAAATAQTGLKAKALGDIPFRRTFNDSSGQSFFFDPNLFKTGTSFNADPNNATGQALTSTFNNFLDQNFVNDPILGRIRDKFGNDTFKAFDKGPGGKNFKFSGKAKFLQDAQDEFLNSSMFSDATSNPAVDTILSRIGGDNFNGFNAFLRNNPRFGFNAPGGPNQIKLVNNQPVFNDPFQVDTGNLSAAADAFLAGQTATNEPPIIGTNAPNPDEQGTTTGTVIDTAAANTIFQDNFPGIDLGNRTDLTDLSKSLEDFYKTDVGKLYLNSGIDINVDLSGLKTPQGLTNEDLTNFSTDFKAFRDAQVGDTGAGTDTGTGAGTDTSTDGGTGTESALFDALVPTVTGLISQKFDPTKEATAFQEGVGNPARRSLRETALPGIRESFAGGNLFGSGRQKAEQRATVNLENQLASDKSKFITGQKNSFENRKLVNINQALTLLKIPAELENVKASTKSIEATAVSLFANIELQKALVDSNITNSQLQMLLNIAAITKLDQDQLQAQDIAALNNAFTDKNGFNLSAVIGIMSNVLDRQSTAFINKG